MASIGNFESENDDIPRYVDAALQSKPSELHLETLVNIIHNNLKHGELASRYVAYAWHLIHTRELYSGDGRTFDEFKNEMEYDTVIAPVIAQSETCERAKAMYRQSILHYWKRPVEELMGPHSPSYWSQGLLKNLAALSRQVEWNEAEKLIAVAKQQRPDRGRNVTFVQAVDVARARLLVHQGGDIELTDADCDYDTVEEDNEGDDGGGSHQKKDATITPCSGVACPSEAKRILESCLRMGNRPSRGKGLDLLHQAIKSGLSKICYPHLRILAGVTVGLLTNRGRATLKKLLTEIGATCPDQDALKAYQRSHMTDFNMSQAGGTLARKHGPLRWLPMDISPPRSAFEPRVIFERYANMARPNPGAWEAFQHDGTVNISGFFDHIFASDSNLSFPSPLHMFEQESNMYKHHCRVTSFGRRRMGWIRTSFFALYQQVMRQDPAYWAIMVSARPDLNERLISYPYYLKDTDPNERTSFRHFDINVPEFLRSGRGGLLTQSSVSCDDEDANNCTELVKGFHREGRMATYWKRRVEREQSKSQPIIGAGLTTAIQENQYTAEDSRDLGPFTPVPNSRGGIRITRPDIPHGTRNATRRRRVVHVWHTGIRGDDHYVLDHTESETWDVLARCHHELMSGSSSPSGMPLRSGGLPFPFPASVRLPSTSAVGDALIGARKWTDPLVIRERNILLGSDDVVALAFVRHIRERQIEVWRQAFKVVQELECMYFPEHSYFLDPGRFNGYEEDEEGEEDGEEDDKEDGEEDNEE